MAKLLSKHYLFIFLYIFLRQRGQLERESWVGTMPSAEPNVGIYLTTHVEAKKNKAIPTSSLAMT